MRIKALKNFPYGGKRWRPGDTDEVRNDHARLLIATGRAERAPAKVFEATRVEALPVATPAPPFLDLQKQEADSEKPARKRAYERRDMKAKE